MNHSDIEKVVLQSLYEAYFVSGSAVNLDKICQEGGWDSKAFWKTVDHMADQGLLSAWTMGGNYKIDAPGVISCEETGIASEELIKANQHARTLILDALAKVYEESGSFADTYVDALSGRTGLDTRVIVRNLTVLQDLGYVEPEPTGTSKISRMGLEAVEDWRQRNRLVDEFERISEMQAQPRGRALQKWFAELGQHNGWSHEEGVRTSHEEMDVIIHKGRDYYLIECKWEKDPIEADVVREIYGKLSNRAGVQGMIVSMSGFTGGAVTQGEDYSNNRIILFFGPADVRSLVYTNTSLDELLNAKYQQLVTRRKMIFG